jgi:anion-transporting  ArsA/GET3 family ATPase
MFGGFRERAEQTYRVLQAGETAFLVVAAPEPDAIREAAYFAGRLAAERMPLAGLVLNRVATLAAGGLTAETARGAAARLAELGDQQPTADTLRVHADLVELNARQEHVSARFRAQYPSVPVVEVAAQPVDIHDVDGLRTIGTALAS